MKTEEFDYCLPEELIAQYPAEERDQSRLLVVTSKKNKIEDRVFSQIGDYLKKDDLLVMNNSRVFPARLFGTKAGGRREVEIFLVRRLGPKRYEALARPGKRLKPGAEVLIEKNGHKIIATIEEYTSIGRIVSFNRNVFEWLYDVGEIPLPPYINRAADERDRERYQTIYAESVGSVAAPTAGLHFTESLVQSIKDKGVKIVYVTLHVGPGTFKPVKSKLVSEHQMDREYYSVSQETLNEIIKAKKEARRVVAVGTTATRVLESLPKDITGRDGLEGATEIFIYPPYEFKIVDALITNFHLPKSTLLMLVSALGGGELIKKAYEHAVRMRYRFYSYGDAMFIQS